MVVWVQFLVCAAVILYTGTQLVRYGDVIADRTGLSKNWIGLVLLATVTSLPELFTAVSAVTLEDLPNMAVSSTIGSCMFNMIIIALLDLVSKKKPVSRMVHQGHILSAGFGIILMGLAAIDILFGKWLPILSHLNKIDPLTLAYPIVYLIAMRILFSYEKTRLKDYVVEESSKVVSSKDSLLKASLMFAFHSALITAAAIYLPAVGEQIAKITGWGEGFIGASFVAAATSLPEAAVSFSAARRGSFDMAVANLLGSNLFNIVILSITDFCYLKAPLLRSVSENNVLMALTAMVATAIVVIGLTYRPEKKMLIMAADAIAILCLCVLANVFLFVMH